MSIGECLVALFSRRFLQRALTDSRSYLSREEQQAFCTDLNTFRENYLAKEWELAILHAVSALGELRYEPQLTGTRRPDILFTGKDGFSFAADVTAVSDKNIHKQNPSEALQREFWTRVRKLGANDGGFDIRIGAYRETAQNVKPRLKLPKIADFPTKIFGKNFSRFIHETTASPNAMRQFSVEDHETSVLITYNPQR